MDARAALSVVECIAKLLNEKLKIDVLSMDKDVQELDKKMISVIKELASPQPGKQQKLDYFL